MTIFIGGAWPYANGSLHLGHIAALLPGDVLARYFRQKGEDVLYVSGSDCHGTPIAIRANQEGVSPKAIADRYHKDFTDCFTKLGFSYDLYTRTDQDFHHKVVQEVFSALLQNEILYPQLVEQTYCEHCRQFLPDRYIEGVCPHCGNIARGDQCDFCSALVDPSALQDPKCKLCGHPPTLKTTEHFFLALSKFQKTLEDYVDQSNHWRENAIQLTKRYLREGLQDRAATRDLPWGIDIPLPGYEGKKIYVWIEAVTGYLSASKEWSHQTGLDWKPFWDQGCTAYYIHGKDNIPFHTLILPALLLGTGNLHLPDHIISSEHLTIEGKKISTSRNWAIWASDVLDRYHPDSLRYFLVINGPEKRDADFSWREFIHRHNGELLGAFGNFVNRTLVFIHKYFDGKVPLSTDPVDILEQLNTLYSTAGLQIEQGELKNALEDIFSFIRKANKYFDEQKPWIQIKEAPANCAVTVNTCIQIIANLSNLLEPFLPFTCAKIRSFLSLPAPCWDYTEIPGFHPISLTEILFQRIDPRQIEEELKKINGR